MKLPVSRLPASQSTGAVVVLDQNSDCVCICDDEEMADELVQLLNNWGRQAVPMALAENIRKALAGSENNQVLVDRELLEELVNSTSTRTTINKEKS